MRIIYPFTHMVQGAVFVIINKTCARNPASYPQYSEQYKFRLTARKKSIILPNTHMLMYICDKEASSHQNINMCALSPQHKYIHIYRENRIFHKRMRNCIRISASSYIKRKSFSDSLLTHMEFLYVCITTHWIYTSERK